MINLKYSGQRSLSASVQRSLSASVQRTLPRGGLTSAVAHQTLTLPVTGSAAAYAARLGLSMVIPTVAYADGRWVPEYTVPVTYRKHRHAAPCPTPPAEGKFSAAHLAVSTLSAAQYLLSRHDDAQALIDDGLDNLPYARVDYAPGGVMVEGTLCSSELCAAAYVLARWW